MIDYHIHSNLSFDGYDSPARTAKSAAKKGLTEICFTEHMELDPPADEYESVDFALYDRELKKAKNWAEHLAIKKGVEVTLREHCAGRASALIRENDVDFVIASAHFVDDKDPYYLENFEGMSAYDVCLRYLSEMDAALDEWKDYDVLGHLGYVCKYLAPNEGKYAGKPRLFGYDAFPELLDSVLKKVIANGSGIEVNTSSYYMLDTHLPHRSVIRRYLDLGGEILTIGSDSHDADGVGFRLHEAAYILHELGAKYICTFDRRKPVFHPIDSM